MENKTVIFGGLEGGASNSTLVLVSADGHVLAEVASELSTNHWMIGIDECFRRIAQMVTNALKMASLPEETQLSAIGLCLSGCEDETVNKEMSDKFIQQYPSLADQCFVASDTLGSLLTAAPDGGVVLIAGTGSNCLLFNGDQSSVKCGGWGHVLGDYGSAYWIANEAIRAVIESEENFRTIPFNVSAVRRAVFEHFQVVAISQLLSPAYSHFDKRHFAAVCKSIAELAVKDNDPLAKDLFSRAGRVLAEHINGVLPKADPCLLSRSGGLPVVCVGSVFKSWSLLSKAFFETISDKIPEISFKRLVKSSAFGAALNAAKHSGHTIDFDFESNSQLLEHFSRRQ
ncbi:unnamed protein product [Medioppia subpectinata]|uniref:N-acetyl-D-glucosamine kinase n=1 Tax=Medioppia subpectinata TaxID=1979941 RepID=A0A7R9KJF0_9ACAR|nr:unnamed protein product [Medioppia subpectinata]CAG2104365.1 unnamed protein product [Medioppia subpectinata]